MKEMKDEIRNSGEDVMATFLAVVSVPPELTSEQIRQACREATISPGYQIHSQLDGSEWQVRLHAESMEAVRSHAVELTRLLEGSTYSLLGPSVAD